jgi:carbon monoxide dehydrogenase subunit G
VQQTGEFRIAAVRETVWRALNDPDVLKQCIDGCQDLAKVGDDAFTATVKAKVGPVSATFGADLKLADLNPPSSYTLNAAVKGGAAGFGKGVARVSLADDGGATILRYEVEGNVGGKLAQIGSRLIDGVAAKVADDFFACFAARLGAVPAPPSAVAAPVDMQAAAMRKLWIRLALAIVIVAAMAIYWLTRPAAGG